MEERKFVPGSLLGILEKVNADSRDNKKFYVVDRILNIDYIGDLGMHQRSFVGTFPRV